MTLTMSNRLVLSEFEQVLEEHVEPQMCLFESMRIDIKKSTTKDIIIVKIILGGLQQTVFFFYFLLGLKCIFLGLGIFFNLRNILCSFFCFTNLHLILKSLGLFYFKRN